MGGVVGAGLVYANYLHAIDIFEGGRGVRTLSTASLFSTYAVSSRMKQVLTQNFDFVKLNYMSNGSCFFSEFLATGVLMVMILAATDKRNLPPPTGLLPLVLFLVILGIGVALGMETGVCLVFISPTPFESEAIQCSICTESRA